MSKLGTTEIERIAKLARLGLTADEAARMTSELSSILEFVEQLQAVDIDDVDPTDQVAGLEDIWREDVIRPSLPRDQLLANAPAQQNGYVVVKRVRE